MSDCGCLGCRLPFIRCIVSAKEEPRNTSIWHSYVEYRRKHGRTLPYADEWFSKCSRVQGFKPLDTVALETIQTAVMCNRFRVLRFTDLPFHPPKTDLANRRDLPFIGYFGQFVFEFEPLDVEREIFSPARDIRLLDDINIPWVYPKEYIVGGLFQCRLKQVTSLFLKQLEKHVRIGGFSGVTFPQYDPVKHDIENQNITCYVFSGRLSYGGNFFHKEPLNKKVAKGTVRIASWKMQVFGRGRKVILSMDNVVPEQECEIVHDPQGPMLDHSLDMYYPLSESDKIDGFV